jgi:hypothetical protein
MTVDPIGAGGVSAVAGAGMGAAGTTPPAGGGGASAGTAGTTMAGAGAGAAGTMAGAGAAGTMAGAGAGGVTGGAGAAGTMAGAGTGGMMGGAGTGGMMGDGMCCDDGNCLCHTPPPASHTLDNGPFDTGMYDLAGVGCVFYPDDPAATGKFAAVAVADGFTGTGGCRSIMTGGWGEFYASWGIVLINMEVPSCCVPERGTALTAGIAALKAENAKSGSPLFEKLAGRYGVSGFSMGGGGSTLAARADPTLLTSVPIMSHQPVSDVMVPTLFTCGSSDTALLGGCGGFGMPAYSRMPAGVPKGIFTVRSGHAGQPTSGGQGQYVLPFQKVFLEGDERWRPLLLATPFDAKENLE